jgi:NTE family protein
MKIGIALGGGAARGWAHIGVLRALVEAGIVPDVIAGTSIGAVVGGCFTADRLDELEDFARSLTRRRVFGYLDFNLAGTGLITGQRLTERLESAIGELTIESLERPFTAVATEIGTGHEVWLTHGKLVDAMRASYALPGIFRPVRLEGRWLFDGALVNPIPVTVCRAMGARYVVAINLNSDMCGRGTVLPDLPARELAPVETTEPIKAKNGRAALKLLQRQFFGRRAAEVEGEPAPGISTVVLDALNIVQDRIARSRLAGDPPDAVINPRLLGIGPFEFHRADELIERGRVAARREIDDIVGELSVRGRTVRRAERAALLDHQQA